MKTQLLLLIFFLGIALPVQGQDSLEIGTLSQMGMDSISIDRQVDSIMTRAIQQQAFPGAQLLVAKNNKVVFHKTYGFHTYDSVQKVGLNDLYDLASVTKITGPLPALMKLVEEKKLDLEAPFSTYWKAWAKKEDKKDLTLRQILSHQAGLVPYIVFLGKVLKNGKPKNRFIRTSYSKRFPIQVYENLYVNKRYPSKMQRIINRSKVSTDKTYKYSGLSFLIFPELISQLTGMDYETYLKKTFYEPLGCSTMGFNPSSKGLSNPIIPTEMDTLFRKTLTHGYVHDENAALLGGVSGNAGLFATAEDLAKLMLFYQNYGATPQGTQLIAKETVQEFTQIQYPENENRRGLGFDKPLIGNDTLPLADAYPAPLASSKSFGHSGFTGTFAWADPENQLVFIFLSNRVHPYRSHRKLYKLNVRTALQQVFYEAISE